MAGFRDGLLDWTIPAGRWGGTAVRVSVLIPLAGLAAAARAGDAACGVLVAAGLLAFAAAQSAARCGAAAAGGEPIAGLLLWPLGGLETAADPPVRKWTVHLAGPVCGVLAVLAGYGACLLLGVPTRPWVRPGEVGSVADAAGVFLLCGGVVAAANLLPAWPLAGGRVLRDELAGRFGRPAGTAAALRASHAVGVAALVVAAAFGSAWVAVAAACTLLLARDARPAPRPRRRERRERERETFLGYDFSAGYTSLDRSAGDSDDSEAFDAPDQDDQVPEPSPPGGVGGFLAVWKQHRAARQAAREAELDRAAEADVDRLLAKISHEGEASLTAAERRALRRAAARFRTRPRGG